MFLKINQSSNQDLEAHGFKFCGVAGEKVEELVPVDHEGCLLALELLQVREVEEGNLLVVFMRCDKLLVIDINIFLGKHIFAYN